MVNHFVAEFRRKYNKDMSENPKALGRLSAASEKAKRMLSSITETSIDIDCLFEGIDFNSTISRARFDRLNMDLFTSCIDSVKKCLSDGKMKKEYVYDVVLVGGSTRIPKVQELLKDFFDGKELCNSINPDEAVAYGAAIQAAIMSGVRHNQDFTLFDVTPLSLGLENSHELMKVFILRNTTIPSKNVQTWRTADDNVEVAEFCVYEGERHMAKDNFSGKFVLNDIPPAPKGHENFKVCFNIDNNGILTVSAQHIGTNNKDQITITDHRGRSSTDINRLVKEAEKYKAEDEKPKRALKSKHALQMYSNSSLDLLKRCGKQIADRLTKMMMEAAIDETTEWLEENFNVDEPNIYEEKLLQKICDPLVDLLN